jgi:hypothetical protein
MLPHRNKITGYILISAGLILAVLYFTVDFRFEVPVFAVFSSYVETRFFTFFKTNFADELILITLIAGLLIVSFSREREESELLRETRLKAIVYAVLINSFFLILSLLFVFGGGFMGILVGNIYSPFIFYLIIFNHLRRKKAKD